MAIAQVVTLAVGSEFGFKRPLISAMPIMETIKEANSSTTILGTLADVPTKVIEISTPSDFILPTGTTSSVQILSTYGFNFFEQLKPWAADTTQTITISNVGTGDVTIYPIQFSTGTTTTNIVLPVLYSTTGTYVLPAGRSSDIILSYYGSDIGEFTSYFNVTSDSGISPYTIFTNQIVGSTYGFSVIPRSFTTSTTHFGQDSSVIYNLTPLFNGIPRPDVIMSLATSIAGSSAWSIKGTGTNSVSVIFRPNEVNNNTGTYISTLTITANAMTKHITNTGIINIDYNKNKPLSSWLSPVSSNNSIIGLSYDLEDDIRYLTIGVAMGGDAFPVYAHGGYIYDKLSTLGLHAAHLDQPYPFWAEVYRFKLTEGEKVYYSGDIDVDGNPIQCKFSENGQDFGYYFGEFNEQGSMFIVKDDGYGSLTIEINHLRELSGDDTFDTTLQNLTRAFYYYSGVDIPPRPPQEPQYTSPIDAFTTYLFIGFNYNTRDKIAFVNTSIVALPT
jgi:hypothetical protein